jgi:N-acetylmuramoyl-L-alanine amidase
MGRRIESPRATGVRKSALSFSPITLEAEMNIVISSGHGLYVRGATGYIDEVDEARLVVERVADVLRNLDNEVITYHDDVSHSQDENLRRIVDFHNSKSRDLDVSVHFNAYVETPKPMGTEVLYVTQHDLADKVCDAISWCGFLNRGAKKRTDLYFLNQTEAPSILIETCFVDSEADVDIYNKQFDSICKAIAVALDTDEDEGISHPPPTEALVSLVGKVSQFGGPADTGVDEDEGLAFIQEVEQAPHLFLPFQPEGTTGLARRLNPYVHYIACRWDYSATPHAMLLDEVALVRATRTGIELKAFPADWGPHVDTGRVADISPGLMSDLGISTDDEVEVTFPFVEE